MTASEMLEAVKKNLNIQDDSQDLAISDMVVAVCDYCNLSQECIPEILEPVIRKKVKVSWTTRRPKAPAISRRWPA